MNIYDAEYPAAYEKAKKMNEDLLAAANWKYPVAPPPIVPLKDIQDPNKFELWKAQVRTFLYIADAEYVINVTTRAFFDALLIPLGTISPLQYIGGLLRAITKYREVEVNLGEEFCFRSVVNFLLDFEPVSRDIKVFIKTEAGKTLKIGALSMFITTISGTDKVVGLSQRFQTLAARGVFCSSNNHGDTRQDECRGYLDGLRERGYYPGCGKPRPFFCTNHGWDKDHDSLQCPQFKAGKNRASVEPSNAVQVARSS
eukprot:Ihof_evm5s160 gene=Ihof_evmTU5s160